MNNLKLIINLFFNNQNFNCLMGREKKNLRQRIANFYAQIVSSSGLINFYDVVSKEKEELKELKLIFLAKCFFFYKNFHDSQKYINSTVYTRKTDHIVIYESDDTGKNAKSIGSGLPSDMDKLKKDRQISTGCFVYGLNADNKIVRLRLSALQLSLFIKFEGENDGMQPDFILGSRAATKEEIKAYPLVKNYPTFTFFDADTDQDVTITVDEIEETELKVDNFIKGQLLAKKENA